jgi:hypothetical protein
MQASVNISNKVEKEALDYAIRNYCSETDTHLHLDKDYILKNFDLTGKNILDFGSGMGSMPLWYKSNWNCNVTCIDIDENHIEISKKLFEQFNVHDIQLECRDIIKDPLTGKYDFILLTDVVEHLEISILPKIIQQLESALAQNGVMYVSFPPWQGPYASHVEHVIGFPWCQFIPDFILVPMIKKRNLELAGSIEQTLIDAYFGLNRMTFGKLMMIIKKQTQLKLTKRIAHTILNKLSFFKNINFTIFPLNLLISKEILIFEHSKD